MNIHFHNLSKLTRRAGCTSKAIHSILQVSKRNFKALNGAVRTIPVKGNARVTKSTKTNTPTMKVKSEAEALAAANGAPATPPETPIKEEGNGFNGDPETPSKRRSTPRKVVACDYVALNGNGSDSDGEPSSEDSQPTDAEFSAGKDAERDDEEAF